MEKFPVGLLEIRMLAIRILSNIRIGYSLFGYLIIRILRKIFEIFENWIPNIRVFEVLEYTNLTDSPNFQRSIFGFPFSDFCQDRNLKIW